MESTLQVKVLNCKDLKPTNFNFFQKLNVFVSVALASDDPNRRPKSQHQKTTTEEEKDGNLEWNREMRFDLDGIRLTDCDHLFLTFSFFTPGNLLFGDKLLGDVRVPLKDMVEEWSGAARFTSYEVRTIDGKPNGVLHFSYRFDLNGDAVEPSVMRIDGCNPVVDAHQIQSENGNENLFPKIEYPEIDFGNGADGGGGYGYNRPAEVVHVAHNGFPISGVVHVSHEEMSLQGQPQNMGFYPPPNPHMFPPGPPPPPLPPHMLYHHHHQPHSPSSPHLGSPFHSHSHHPPPPPPPVNHWGYEGAYDHGSGHGAGEHARDRDLGNYYHNY